MPRILLKRRPARHQPEVHTARRMSHGTEAPALRRSANLDRMSKRFRMVPQYVERGEGWLYTGHKAVLCTGTSRSVPGSGASL